MNSRQSWQEDAERDLQVVVEKVAPGEGFERHFTSKRTLSMRKKDEPQSFACFPAISAFSKSCKLKLYRGPFSMILDLLDPDPGRAR